MRTLIAPALFLAVAVPAAAVATPQRVVETGAHFEGALGLSFVLN